ncbi:hypothetical protein SAMN05892883_0199 [Jatrophihabitans sp. GAS493]|uniref:hypothetical protein n=1 Tax=Jatrophihabitans sp. GAS493 TaxID=1907575 RepID=UPI000BB6E057|nr:hypothetical protein [Jatrophihabitans sp. GAS493]SOD70505.1 hypothetical protein SAMN05892883_0199 [Jatrophihabitans sp. GAS493]
MNWTQTHQRYQALREIESELDLRLDGELPWRPGYAAVFGDRDGLLFALQLQWNVAAQAQLDEQFLDAEELEQARRELAARHPGLLLALRRNGTRRLPPVPVSEQHCRHDAARRAS